MVSSNRGEYGTVRYEDIERWADSHKWLGFPVRLFIHTRADGCTGHAAMVAYNFFLAIPVGAIFLVSFISIIPGIDIASGLHDQLKGVVPDDGLELIDDIARDALEGGRELLIISLIGTVYVLNNAYTGITTSLNAAYNIRETRPWLKVRLRAFTLSIYVTALLIAAFAFVTAAPGIVDYLSDNPGAPQTAALWLSRLRWPAIVILGILAIEAAYRYSVKGGPRWRLISPGTVVAEASWVIATLGFGYYVNNFASYDKVYGTLAAVVVLMVWLWISAMTFLVGGEINKLWRLMEVRAGGDGEETGAPPPRTRVEQQPPAEQQSPAGEPTAGEPTVRIQRPRDV
jgi:membrane protein